MFECLWVTFYTETMQPYLMIEDILNCIESSALGHIVGVKIIVYLIL